MNLRKLIILFASTSLVIYLLQFITAFPMVHPLIWKVQLFFFCTFLISIRINQIGMSRPTQQFHIFYFASMTIRFFLAVFLLFFAILTIKSQLVVLVCNFIVMYLLYTWFEIYFLIHNLRADLKKTDASN